MIVASKCRQRSSDKPCTLFEVEAVEAIMLERLP